tara:strand:- start:1027 stop:2703 length:1677 start_codon:yes stop_codon:yes gene_type:complete
MLITKFLHNCLKEALQKLIDEQNITNFTPPVYVVEKPKNKNHGDYATNLPMQLAKIFKENPLSIANKIKDKFDADNLEEISVASPGFINFKLSKTWLEKEIIRCIELKNNFGNQNKKNKKVQVEFVSVNPTGKLHLGHIRGAVIGSTISNILESQNFTVTREYYVNDAGNQIEFFCKSIIERIKELQGKNFNITEEMYNGIDVVDISKKIINEYPDYQNYDFSKITEDEFENLKKISIEICINEIIEDLKSLNIFHDNWFYESNLIDTKYLDETIGVLKELNLIYIKDEATWIKTEELGDDRDNVLFKSNDNKPTYFATDIAYHRNKFKERSFEKVINVWGSDHHGHIKRMELILEKLKINPKNFDVILNQIVSLKSNDKTIKFSKRSGNSIFLSEIVEKIGADACRFSFLSRSSESQMEIDLDLFKNKSSENPVFYIQYAHARLCSILKNAEERQIDFESEKILSLKTLEEINLAKKITEFPELLHRVSENYGVHELTFFALELSQLIQKFYENNRVFDKESKDDEITKSRLIITKASKITLANLLTLMGMSSPEEM